MLNTNERINNLRLYAKLLQQLVGLMAIIFEIWTGEKPPPAKELLKEYGRKPQ